MEKLSNPIYALIAIGVAAVIYWGLSKFGNKAGAMASEYEDAMKMQRECMELARESLKEQQETNRLLKEIKEVMEKK